MQLRYLNKTVTLESAGMVGDGGTNPDLVTLSNGNLLAVWSEVLAQPTDDFSDTNGAVFARVLNADGVAQTDIIQVNINEAYFDGTPHAVATQLGGFAVGWTSTAVFGTETTDVDTFVRFFDAEGTTFSDFVLDVIEDNPEQVYEEPEDIASTVQQLQEIVQIDQNRFAVILEDSQTKIYSNNAVERNFIERPASDVAQLTSGNIVRAWVNSELVSGEDDPAPNLIELRMTGDALNNPVGIPGIYEPLIFTVEADDVVERNTVQLAALATGGFAMAHVEKDGSASAVHVTVFTELGQIAHNGDVITRSFAYNDVTGEFDLISLSDGGMILAMVTNNNKINVIHIDDNGLIESQLPVDASTTGNLSNPTLTELQDGRIALGYVDDSGDGLGGPMRIAYFDVVAPRANVDGTAGADVLFGLGGNDTILGLGGNDSINGRGGNDKIFGGAGHDTLLGAAGRDALRGGDGNDDLIGGAGADGLGGGAGNDILNGGLGRDVLGGGLGDDRLIGAGGDDVLRGGHGADILAGGAGADSFRFFNGDSGIDRVTDFNAAQDSLVIALNGLEQSDVRVVSNGTNTRILIGDDTEALLQNVDLTKAMIDIEYI